MKFGKPEQEEMDMTSYVLDSSAHAVVLCDYGESWFEYAQLGDKGWQVHFKRHVRIKVLDKEGTSAGDLSFRLYREGLDKEKIEDIDGITFNMENGKLVKSKLENSALMEEEADKYHVNVKFAMPNVKAGSVIDLRYSIISDFLFNLQSWHFQHNIPVKWSEYVVQVPEYFTYHHSMLGYYPLQINESKSLTNSITFTERTRITPNTQGSTSTSKLDYTVYQERFAMANVPAFIEEAYLTTADNFRSSISYELAATKSSTGIYTSYTTSWEKINSLLLEAEDFGTASKHAGFMSDVLDPMKAASKDTLSLMKEVFYLVQKSMKWTGYNSIFGENTRKAWKDKAGSSGEINLILCAALRSCDIQAAPVVLSTRSNGILNLTHPSVSDLNYVVVLATTGGKQYLLDATDKYVPFGLLPERCMNGKGRLVNSKGGEWVGLNPIGGDSRIAQYELTIDPDGSIAGTVTENRNFYSALDARNKIGRFSTVNDYAKEYGKDIPGFILKTFQIIAKDSLEMPLQRKMEFKVTNALDMSAGLLLVNPLLFEATSGNPFKLKEREYPVEFSYPRNETLIFKWQIPQGYRVDELPKPAIITLPNDAGKFTFSISEASDLITVFSKIQISKLIYTKEEYSDLKEFFNLIIAKQAEQIVLKKL